MICPYLKITTTYQTPRGIKKEEQYNECYKKKCPFYDGGVDQVSGKPYEYCDRAERGLP